MTKPAELSLMQAPTRAPRPAATTNLTLQRSLDRLRYRRAKAAVTIGEGEKALVDRMSKGKNPHLYVAHVSRRQHVLEQLDAEIAALEARV